MSIHISINGLPPTTGPVYTYGCVQKWVVVHLKRYIHHLYSIIFHNNMLMKDTKIVMNKPNIRIESQAESM